MPKLDVYRQGKKLLVAPVGMGGVIIGRAEDADVRLDDKLVSRQHARVIQGDGGWVVEDMKTRNGTHVNGLKEFRRSLANGDRIEVGPFVLVFSKEAGEATPDLSWAKPAPKKVVEELAAETPPPGDDLELDIDMPAPARPPAPGKSEATSLASPKELAKIRAEARARLQPHLRIQERAGEAIIALKPGAETTIGAGRDAQVRLPAAKRSLAAAIVGGKDGTFTLVKRAWFSSVRVNGEKVRKVALEDGDVIDLGDARVTFASGAKK